jgi:squalene-hopene/tetraprenyl-beta-curcumene cyclase
VTEQIWTMPGETLSAPPDEALEDAVNRASALLRQRQNDDGHWVFPLEADATIPAEYVLLEHFLDRIEPELERKIGVYLREIQADHGGWPLFHAGAFDLSASVKAYFALKILGDDQDSPHMVRARTAILAAGGAERSNVFTRAQLALFGEIPWRGVPVMPVQIMLLPRWFPFHLDKVSYWSRTVTAPLLVLMALRPKARNPGGVRVQELFQTPPGQVRDWIRGPFRSGWGHFFRHLDSVLRVVEPLFPLRKQAIARAVAFVSARLNGEDGVGGIYPAMANTVMMFDTIGYDPKHPQAAGDRGRAGLLPALPVPGLGHSARRPRDRRGGRRGRLVGRRRQPVAPRAPGDGACWRLGRRPSRHHPRRLGVPVRKSRLPRCR